MSQAMNIWSDLPTEILSIITAYCGRNSRQVKWMFVNICWFTFYLSKVYDAIRTSLGNETFVDKILYSSFDIGKYVKHVHLSNIKKHKKLYELYVHSDHLGMIMKKTPNVDEVSLFRTVSQANGRLIDKDWLYFSVVLINTNCWNLKFLPTLGEDNIYSAAYYSRHALERLELFFGMFGSHDFNCLKEFRSLKTLEVHKNLINGLNGLTKFRIPASVYTKATKTSYSVRQQACLSSYKVSTYRVLQSQDTTFI